MKIAASTTAMLSLHEHAQHMHNLLYEAEACSLGFVHPTCYITTIYICMYVSMYAYRVAVPKVMISSTECR